MHALHRQGEGRTSLTFAGHDTVKLFILVCATDFAARTFRTHFTRILFSGDNDSNSIAFQSAEERVREPWFVVYIGQSYTSPASIVHTVGSSRPMRWCAGAVCTISLAHRYLPATVHLMKCSSSAPSSSDTCTVQSPQPCPLPTCLYMWTQSPAECDAVASRQCGFDPDGDSWDLTFRGGRAQPLSSKTQSGSSLHVC